MLVSRSLASHLFREVNNRVRLIYIGRRYQSADIQPIQSQCDGHDDVGMLSMLWEAGSRLARRRIIIRGEGKV